MKKISQTIFKFHSGVVKSNFYFAFLKRIGCQSQFIHCIWFFAMMNLLLFLSIIAFVLFYFFSRADK